jgi:hypothetical protein
LPHRSWKGVDLLLLTARRRSDLSHELIPLNFIPRPGSRGDGTSPG